MTKFKRLTAVLLSVVMLMCCFSVQASARGVFDGAVKIEPFSYFSNFTYERGDYHFYKIVIPYSGDIIFRFSESSGIEFQLFDSTGKEYNVEYYNNYTKYTENLKKGTYYLKLSNNPNHMASSQYIYNLYYCYIPDNPPILSLAIKTTIGSELNLTAIPIDYSGNITWTTTKKSVATVKNGHVKVLSSGKAKIRVYIETGEYVELLIIAK